MSQPTPYLFLGRERTLYLGPLAPQMKLSLAASRLLVAVDGDLRVRCRHQSQSWRCQSVLLPVGGQFTVESSSTLVADCHLDVTGKDFASLKLRAGISHDDSWYTCLADEDRLSQAFLKLSQQPSPAAEMASLMEQILFPADAVMNDDHHVDQRIRHTIDLIRDNVTGNPPLSELAEAAGLSNSRLVNLFKSQVGVPVRRYRLWHRLFVACGKLAGGASITEAAHASGFTDGAHLSHTFRDILGIKPSELFGPQRLLRAEVEPMVSIATHMA